MSLAVVTPPPEDRFDLKYTYESTSYPRSSTGTTSKPLHGYQHTHIQPHGRSSTNSAEMSTHHRGLPPPSAMTLPDPRRSAVPPSMSPGYTQVSTSASSQYQPQDDHARDIHTQARMEEDKKRQEEQKTRQEELRLEQRKIEHNMLRESFQGGVPPHLVPMIFAGIGGGNLASAALEMAQQYLVQFQPQVAPQQHAQQDRTRDPNNIVHPNYLPSQPSQPSSVQTPQTTTVYPSPAYNTSPQHRSKGLVPATRSIPQSTGGNLPKLTTNEAQVSAPTAAYSHGHHSSHSGSQDAGGGSSSNILFHHWQPPNTQSNQSSGKDGHKSTPNSSGNLSSTGDSSSPRKRKAQGPHEAAPVSSVQKTTSSPPLSIASSTSTRRPGHSKGESAGSFKAAEAVDNTSLREQSSYGSPEEDKEALKKTPPERYSSAEPNRPPPATATIQSET